MKTNYEIRYAAHPEDAKSYDTKRIRRDFLIEKVFSANEVNMVYSMYDRMVVGGAMPVGEVLKLEAIDPLKAPFFLTRREMGIYNVGGLGVVKAGDAVFEGVPQFEVSKDAVAAGVKAVDLFTENAAIFASKGEMRKLVQGGGVSLNKEKLEAFDQVITSADLLDEKYLLVQRGKKNYYLIIAK